MPTVANLLIFILGCSSEMVVDRVDCYIIKIIMIMKDFDWWLNLQACLPMVQSLIHHGTEENQ